VGASSSAGFERLDRAKRGRLESVQALETDTRDSLRRVQSGISTSQQLLEQTVAGIVSDVSWPHLVFQFNADMLIR
jgi:hypothetical protein